MTLAIAFVVGFVCGRVTRYLMWPTRRGAGAVPLTRERLTILLGRKEW